jgi:pimeloyl-ACP methyl ester carboxylesterase
LRRRAASRRHGRFDDANDACFIVRDHNGHALAYVYFENEAGQRTAANLLTQRRSAAPEVNDPIIVVYGAETPLRSRAEMEALADLPNVVATVVLHAKLAVHEEFPDQVAATIKNFLLAA